MAGPQILGVGANPIIHLSTVAGDLVVSGAPQSQLQMTGGVRQEVTVDGSEYIIIRFQDVLAKLDEGAAPAKKAKK